jgi:hypothetical protein
MAETIARRPLTAVSEVQTQASLLGFVLAGQSGTGTGFAPRASVLHSQYHSLMLRNFSPSVTDFI